MYSVTSSYFCSFISTTCRTSTFIFIHIHFTSMIATTVHSTDLICILFYHSILFLISHFCHSRALRRRWFRACHHLFLLPFSTCRFTCSYFSYHLFSIFLPFYIRTDTTTCTILVTISFSCLELPTCDSSATYLRYLLRYLRVRYRSYRYTVHTTSFWSACTDSVRCFCSTCSFCTDCRYNRNRFIHLQTT